MAGIDKLKEDIRDRENILKYLKEKGEICICDNNGKIELQYDTCYFYDMDNYTPVNLEKSIDKIFIEKLIILIEDDIKRLKNLLNPSNEPLSREELIDMD